MNSPQHNLLLVAVVVTAAPLLAHSIARWLTVPLVVFEILLGIVLGPQGMGFIGADPFVAFLATLGLAMLFFLAGFELDFDRIRGRPLRRAGVGWCFSLIVGIGFGLLVGRTAAEGIVIGICLTSTALGTILPVLRDAGELHTAFGTAVLAIGAVGEFAPLTAVALFLGGRSPARSGVLLVAFAVLIVGAIVFAARVDHIGVHRIITATLDTSGQFAVRLVLLVLTGFVTLASALGLDILLGAFAAGVLMRLVMSGAEEASARAVRRKLDAVGFGFLIPVFFVNTGIRFDVNALTGRLTTLALVPVFLLLFLVTRGVPATVVAPAGSNWHDRVALALFGATGLPLIAAVTTIGVSHGELHTSTAAALLGAGMLSVLIFPLVALHRRRASRALV